MSGLAACISLMPHEKSAIEARNLMTPVAHRCRMGVVSLESHAVSLAYGRSSFDNHSSFDGPAISDSGNIAVVADAQIYNRIELTARLRLTEKSTISNTAIILRAYETWGDSLTSHLDGDYAIVVFDRSRKAAIAFRDPFGVKPLFFHMAAGHLYFASEPKQLFCAPSFCATPDASAIQDFIISQVPAANEKTFFAQIKRVLAGHAAIFAADRWCQNRYWPSIVNNSFGGSGKEACREFLRLLECAVSKRLVPGSRTGIEVSGGYDSSAIALCASKITKGTDRSNIVLFTQQYPGMPCDETPYSSAVASASGFHHVKMVAPIVDGSSGLQAEVKKTDCPFLDWSWPRSKAWSETMIEHGVRVVLSGIGGDDLCWDPDYLPDILRRRGWLAAMVFVLRANKFRSVRSRLRTLYSLAKIRAWRDRARHVIAEELHAGMSAWAIVGDPLDAVSVADMWSYQPQDFSATQVARWLTDSRFLYSIEFQDAINANNGIEMRYPFLDRNLVGFVLSIPWETRVAVRGAFKSLLIQSLGEMYPPILANRASKATFSPYFNRCMNASLIGVRELFEGKLPMLSSGFVDWPKARSMWRDCERSDARWFGELASIWKPVGLELWLRSLDYPASATA